MLSKSQQQASSPIAESVCTVGSFVTSHVLDSIVIMQMRKGLAIVKPAPNLELQQQLHGNSAFPAAPGMPCPPWQGGPEHPHQDPGKLRSLLWYAVVLCYKF